MSDVLVIGAGGHCKVVVRALQELGHTVVAILDDDPHLHGETLLGIPIAGPVALADDYRHLPAVLAIGDNGIRQALAERLDLEWMTVVHPQADVDKTATLGPGTVVFSGAVIQAETVVGSHAIINTRSSVDHDCQLGDFVHVAPGAHLAGSVSVGEGAMLGIGSSVIQGKQIGAWTTVGAGAAVVSDLPAHVIAVGVPARPGPANPPGENSGNHDSPEDGGLPETTPKDDLAALPETLEEAASKEQAIDRPARVYLSPPHMSPRERELLIEAFDSNWIAPLGPHVDAFELEFANRVGAQHAVALSSGTAALHLSLIMAGVGQGDEVFTSTLTFAATANAITYVGAKPVFIDSDMANWNMDPELLGEALEASAKRGKLPQAVITVDLYGQCADYERIAKLCQFYDVPLIEDAAEALGATYRGQSAGTFGEFGVFSFNGNKIITTSGGGMLVTDRQDLAEKARFLATQARDPAPHYQHSEIGYNYRMSNLLAAVGRGQLAELGSRVEQRRANFEYYREALAEVPGIQFMPEIAGGRSTRWLTCIVIDADEFGATAEDVRLAHERENIESRPLWKPMHLQPVFADCPMIGGRVAERLFERGLCLPSGSSLTASDRQRVVEVLLSVHQRSAVTDAGEVARGVSVEAP